MSDKISCIQLNIRAIQVIMTQYNAYMMFTGVSTYTVASEHGGGGNSIEARVASMAFCMASDGCDLVVAGVLVVGTALAVGAASGWPGDEDAEPL